MVSGNWGIPARTIPVLASSQVSFNNFGVDGPNFKLFVAFGTLNARMNPKMTKTMFEKKQKAFAEKLNRRKEQITTTKPKSPNFEKTKLKLLERDYNNEAKTAVEIERNLRSVKNINYKQALLPKEPEQQPSTTKSTTVLAEKRRS